jgi:hypothetical protein
MVKTVRSLWRNCVLQRQHARQEAQSADAAVVGTKHRQLDCCSLYCDEDILLDVRTLTACKWHWQNQQLVTVTKHRCIKFTIVASKFIVPPN